ncbi:hypothetical protein KV557_10050 [Kitasatospora aureofaciens]|uniref:hypothetical protein n=1 Tax=Kitasatospora aureofaciens TaxID=1894 RepID=UPI001C47AC9A|nr:hypothetical protein [Kitasatospora aureofaciens]MBV6697466.1 hypothetical protein [Kitasatospora aureofaciens]
MLPAPIVDRLRTQLAQVPELITLAHLALLPGSGQRGARVSGATRTAPLPCRVDVLSLLGPTAATVHDDHGDQIAEPSLGILHGWCQVVLEDRRRANDWTAWTRLPGSDHEATVSLATRYLLFHAEFAATRPYARELADEVSALHRHLNRVTGWPIAPTRHARQVCPRCQLMTVTVRPDGMRECSALDCRAVLSTQEYTDRAEQVIAELAAA